MRGTVGRVSIMPTDDERREVARRLRDNAGQKPVWVIPWAAFNDAYEHEGAELINRLADLIEPEERTCRIYDTDHGFEDSIRCDSCQMTFNRPWQPFKFCPNCGARVVNK